MKIDNMQQNNVGICGDETVNHIISKHTANSEKKEYKMRHDWVGKVILWELCKRLKFYYTTKRHMHQIQEFVPENECWFLFGTSWNPFFCIVDTPTF